MKHVFEQHTNCELERCRICDSGLEVCMVCGLVENELTTDCPGTKCTREEAMLAMQGVIDFEGDAWVQRR